MDDLWALRQDMVQAVPLSVNFAKYLGPAKIHHFLRLGSGLASTGANLTIFGDKPI